MADKRISELTNHTAVELTDLLPVVNSSVTKKTTVGATGQAVRNMETPLTASNILLSEDLLSKTAQVSSLGSADIPFKEIFVSSGSINIQPDNPSAPYATITNEVGDVSIRSAGFSLKSGSTTPFQVEEAGLIRLETEYVSPTNRAFVGIVANNEGSASLPTKPGTTLQTTGYDGVSNRLLFDSYGGTDVVSTILLRNADGTAATPLQLTSGSMGRIGVRGYNDVQGFGDDELTPDAYIGFYSPYGFASGSRNAEIRFFTTPSGSADSRQVGVINNSGLDITGSFTASLQEGYMYVGDSNNRTETIPTSSFVQTSQTGSLVNTTYGLFNQTGSSTPISASIVETSLIDGGVGTLSVPSNGFQQGDAYSALLTGTGTFHNNDTLRIRVKAGSTLLADTGNMTLAGATNKRWRMQIDFSIYETGGAGTASILSAGQFFYTKDASTDFQGINFSTENNTTFDTTIHNTLSITAQFSSTNNIIRSRIFTLKKTY